MPRSSPIYFRSDSRNTSWCLLQACKRKTPSKTTARTEYIGVRRWSRSGSTICNWNTTNAVFRETLLVICPYNTPSSFPPAPTSKLQKTIVNEACSGRFSTDHAVASCQIAETVRYCLVTFPVRKQ